MSRDAVVIGGGHNGLVAAWRLAKAGQKVVVCEARTSLGGLAGAEEFHPGYVAPGIHHDTQSWRPWLTEAMDLASHGLARRAAPPRVVIPPQGDPTVLVRNGAAGESVNIDSEDRRALAEWQAFLDKVAPLIRRLLDRPAPRLDANSLGEVFGLARDGLALRLLGRETMTELLRVAPMSVADWLRETLRSPALVEGLMAPALLGTWLGPHSAGSAALLLARESVAHEEVVGGPAALVRGLESACRAAGVEILTEAAVEKILVERGEVVGVLRRGGESIGCQRVLASCNPRTALLDLLPPAVLPLAIRSQVANLRCRGTVAKLHVALDGPLHLAGRDVELAHFGGGSIDAFEQAFDAIKYGRVSDQPLLEVRQPSLTQSDLAPEEGQVLSILAGYVPYDRRGGWTPSVAAELEEAILQRLEQGAPGVRGRIVATQLLTPADIESAYGLPGGQLHHGEHALDQLLFVRPSHRLAHYRTPVGGLFLAGSGSHPGGGVTGVPGWLGAGAALEA